MSSNLHILKIQVPAPRLAPANAARIGELAVTALAAIGAAGTALVAACSGGIRAHLIHNAAITDAHHADSDHRYQKISMKAWDH